MNLWRKKNIIDQQVFWIETFFRCKLKWSCYFWNLCFYDICITEYCDKIWRSYLQMRHLRILGFVFEIRIPEFFPCGFDNRYWSKIFVAKDLVKVKDRVWGSRVNYWFFFIFMNILIFSNFFYQDLRCIMLCSFISNFQLNYYIYAQFYSKKINTILCKIIMELKKYTFKIKCFGLLCIIL